MKIQMNSISDSTLFRKTQRCLLTDKQAAIYRILERERRATMITQTLATQWGQNAKPVRLATETQQKFVEIMLQHGRLPTTQSPYQFYIVLLEIDRLADRLQPLLSDEEWQQLQFPLQQAKRVEQFLRASKQWPIEVMEEDEDLDGNSSDAKKE